MNSLPALAEMGYVLGLDTFGEVASHIICHYDAYWLIDEVPQREAELWALIRGHEDDLVRNHLTDDDCRRIDDELDQALTSSRHAADDSPAK